MSVYKTTGPLVWFCNKVSSQVVFFSLFKLLSTAAVCLVQVTALLIVRDQFNPMLEYVSIGAVAVVIVVWVLLLLATPAENCDLELLDEVCIGYCNK